MITHAVIYKDGEAFAEVTSQRLLPTMDNPEEEEAWLAGGLGVEQVRIALSDCFSQILGDDVDVVFPELEG
ncbi:MAG: hypothetical protein GY934_09710 [Gammaproteobacteria bacterium]|nr:hypothetical protein [Gammaproteobacteria bacterium]